MQSQEAPRRNAREEKETRRGQSNRATGTSDTSARGASAAKPTDTYRRYHWHRNDAANRPAPATHGDRGPGPSKENNGDVRARQQHQPESRVEHRRAHSPQQSVRPRPGHQPDGTVGPTKGKPPGSVTGPRRGSGQPRGSSPRPERFRDQKHPVRPVTSKHGLERKPRQARRSPSPKAHSDSGQGPSNSRNGQVGRRQDHRHDNRTEQRRAHSPQHSVGHKHGHKPGGNVGATNRNQPDSGTGPRLRSERSRGSAQQPEKSDQRHPVRIVTIKDRLGLQPHQAVRSPSRKTCSDSQAGHHHWRNGNVRRRQEDQADGYVEQRRASDPEHKHGHKQEGSFGPKRENETDSGMVRESGTGRAPGSAPWPENMPKGRQPVWAVPSKDWLILVPNTEEPMEVDPPKDMEEPMEVDPPPPELSWDQRGMSLLSAIAEHQQRRRRARPAPYSLLRRHRKH